MSNDLPPLSGPVDASGEPADIMRAARARADRVDADYERLIAATVPSSPAQEQLRETVDAFLTVLKCSDGLEGAFDAAVEKMTVALRRDVLSDRAIWSGFEPPTTAGADPASLYRTELPNKRTDDASAIIAGPQVRERVDRNTGAEMIALKAAYIEGFHAARETDGNSAFEAWLHSAAKLSVFPPSSPWLLIESAPKDGSRILAKDNYDDETVVFWSHGRNEWRLNIGGFHEDTQHDFTYWMPLHTAAALPPSSPVAEAVDVQLLAWAVSNCHTLARRSLAKTALMIDREKWEHVLRICEKAGARSKGVLRASLPTEITDGSGERK